MSDQNIYLLTGTNETFWPQTKEYIETLNNNSSFHNTLITLGFEVDQNEQKNFGSIKFIYLDPEKVISPNPNYCLQHGAFLSALEHLSDEDIIIFTDADIKLQRSFNDDEIEFFKSISEKEIAVSYNKSKTDFLIEEANRLKPNISISEIEKKYPETHEYLTFNTGVIITKYKTYLELYDMYNKFWSEFKNIFVKNAKQQWLLSYLINKYFKPVIIPDIIHTHGKYPVELRVTNDCGYKYVIENRLIALNHSIPNKTEYEVHRLNKRIRSLEKHKKNLIITFASIILLLLLFIIITTL